MKCLIVHFSDIHIENNNTLSSDKIDDIIKTINYQINDNEIKQIIFIFSGDLAFSCKDYEYQSFNIIVQRLKNEISLKNDVFFYFSPGNHDIDFNNVPILRAEIINNKNTNLSSIKDHYLEMMDSFFKYANKYNNFLFGKEIDVHVLNVDDIKIKIVNINSALFSTFKDKNDDDRGIHSFNLSLFDNMNREGCELVLTIMHHSAEWYDSQSIYKLKDYIKNTTDLLFYGHEHVNDELDYNYGNGLFTKKICGGPLSPGEDSLFNCVILDTVRKKYITKKFQWIENKGYDMINNDGEKYLTKYTSLRGNFYNSLLTDRLITNANDFRDFYVFPELNVENDFSEEERIISDVNTFKKELKGKTICIINGNDYSGKTTLAKYMFLSYVDGSFPVLFDLKSLDKNKISKVIPNAFEEQYDQKLLTYSQFLKIDKDHKVAIVDDADKIEKNQFELLVEELKENFGLVIIINGLKSEYDLLELTKKHFANNDECLFLRIGKFYNDERKELIKKAYSLLVSNLSEATIEENASRINKFILNKIKYFNLYPPFIILFVKSMVNNGLEIGTKDVFNEVFSSNITKMMIENNVEVSLMTVLLQRIAYYIHTHKEYPLSQESLFNVITSYNNESDGYRPEVDANAAINDLVKCRLLAKTQGGNSYFFSNNSFLAYFIAKEWLRVQDGNVLSKIINNVCFGINSDILLYICFMYENSQTLFFNKILDSASKHFDSYEEMDFVKNNIKFILQDKKELQILKPSKEEKKNAKKSIKEQEKEITRDSKINYIDIYDYDEEEVLDLAQYSRKGLKYIEILSKILPDFILKMEIEQIQQFVDAIYRLPNKLFFSIFKPVDDEISKELSNDLLGEDIKRFDYGDQIKELQDVSKLLVLNIYDMVARYCISKNTINAFEKFDTRNNYNYLIQKSLFYSELGDTDKFNRTIMPIYNQTNNKAIKNIVKRIYYKHLLYNQIEYRGEIQRSISTLFPEVNKENRGPVNKLPFMRFIRKQKKK